MKHELEIEFKNLLTEAEFLQLTEHFIIEVFHEQTNTYFDTANFAIKSLGGALRIRTKRGKTECTLKLPNQHTHGLDEFTQSFNELFATPEQALNQATDMHKLLQTHGISPKELICLTSLTTKRAECSYKNGILVFDESFYNGLQDFELEFECDNYEKGQYFFQELLTRFQIPIRQTPNKIQRAMSTRCTR
ncbi:MAG: CYTH domain-containing protein [Culicoidibacterales bacterium]